MKHLFTFLLLLSSLSVSAVRNWLPTINNINRMEYGAGTQNWSITQDANGWLYVANNDGLLQFDGNDWHLFGDGILFRSVLPDSRGRIYVGAFNRFGYFSPDEKGALKYHSLSDKLDEKHRNFSDIWGIYSIDHVIYFVSYNYIFKLSQNELTVIESKERMLCSANINGNLYVFKEGAGVFLQTGTLFIPLASTENIAHYHISEILSAPENGLLLITEYNGIYHYHQSSTVPIAVNNEFLIRDSQLYCGKRKDNKLYLGTIKNGLLIVDISTGAVEQYDVRSGLQNNSVLCLDVIEQGSVWLGLDNGISFLELNSPLSNLYSGSQNYGVGYTSAIFDNKIYVGTNQGLYYTDWPIEDIRHLKLTSVEHAAGQVWALTVIGNTLFCGHNNGAYVIENGRARLISKQNGFWNFQQIPGNPDKVMAGTYTGLVILSNEGTVHSPYWKFDHSVEGFDLSCRKLEYDETEHVWWAVHGTGFSAIHMDETMKKVTEVTSFPNITHQETYLFKDQQHVYFTTDHGLYQFDQQRQDFFPEKHWDNRLKGDSYLRIIEKDKYDRIWYIRNNKLLINYKTKKGYETDSISTGGLINNLMSNFEHVNVVDSVVSIISTLDGFSLAKMGSITPIPFMNYAFGVKSISISSGTKDGTSWYFNRTDTTNLNKTIVYPYQPGSSYRFQMNTLRAYNTGIQYDVQLIGQDEQPLLLNHLGTKEYTGLKEGTYTFIVRSYNSYTGMRTTDEVQLQILPPWYRTIYAYLVYFLLLIAFIVVLYRILKYYFNIQHTKRLKELKEESLRREFQLKEEAHEKEKRIVKLEKDKLQQDLLLKSQELSNSLFNVMQKQDIFVSIRDDLRKITTLLRKEEKTEAIRKLNRLLEKVHTNIADEDSWKKLENNFNIVHHDFLSRLKESYPSLTTSDLKLAAYIRMDLITKEVAPLFNISERGLESARLRLRKKLELKREESLSRFLQEF